MMSPLLHCIELMAPSTLSLTYSGEYRSSDLPYRLALSLLLGTEREHAEHISHACRSSAQVHHDWI